ncbi:MAG: flagellar hook-basal body complex protein FliE [Planctomycetota bacterium]|nr:MAG: flagellar hook-basal body complex protein FliE [Planctomycetota bacterium]
MVDGIDPGMIRPIQPSGDPGKSKGLDKTADGKSFQDVFNEAINRVNELQLGANKAIQDIATGDAEDLTEVLNQVKQAELAFDLLMQIRNRLIDAYEEINRMRI